ncbi:MAG: hypothetical protein ACREE0_10005 [Phenylobacterium sp.]
MPLAGENQLSAISKDPQALIRIPVGAASPLWGLFAGAAMTGAAWWWMTRWTRPANLEALFGAAEKASAATLAEVEVLPAPVIEAVEAAPAALEPVVEVAPETMEAVIEDPTPAPIAEALIEAAPISPVLEALAPEAVEPVVEAPLSNTIEAAAEVSEEFKPSPKPKKTITPKAD